MGFDAQILLHHWRVGSYTHDFFGLVMNEELLKLAVSVAQSLTTKHKTLATAESCTGGAIAYLLTEISGSSHWFERGFVTYSNASKIELLGVKNKTIEHYGAVSGETALEMVMGALNHSKADIAIAVTGIAGPTGGSLEKPVGTVFIAWAERNQTPVVQKYLFSGDRHEVRIQTVKTALQCVLNT